MLDPIDSSWIPVPVSEYGASFTGMVIVCYFRFQTGWRFSAKAVTPSRMSSVWSIMYRSARCRAVAYSGGMLRPMSMMRLQASMDRERPA